MYNIIDVKRCYGRFKYGKVFLKKVQDGENAFAQSLFATFRQKNLEKLGKEDDNQLSFREKIGWFSIRNIEILQDLTIYLDEYSYKDKTGDIGKLIEFFSRLASYEIPSYDKAKDALEAQGYLCRLTNIIGVEMDDEVGNLNKLLQTLYSSNINVDYIYLSFNRDSGKPIMVFHTEDTMEVRACLKSRGYTVL